jgi:hypothetical protein
MSKQWAWLVAVVVVSAPLAFGQAPTLLTENFEDGLGEWTVATSPFFSVPWHAAAPGECGAVTGMAACNTGPASCSYLAAPGTGVHYLRLRSPWFTLLGVGPWTISFDYLKSMDAADTATLWLEASGGDGIFSQVISDLPDASGMTHVEVTKSFSAYWPGKAVRLELELRTDSLGDTGFGWLVDNVVVSSAGSWIELGLAKPGSTGTPKLVPTGTLAPGSVNQLSMYLAKPSSIATLVFGLQHLAQPFKGGVMHPQPQALIPLPVDAVGRLEMQFTLPPGTPAGHWLYFQFWIQDAGASFGLSASNGVAGQTG